jgi:AcrR family transcriptional regulator
MTRIPPAARRTALVQAALRVVARDGVAAATTRRIVAEAEMSLASFHYVFSSRDELMAELVNAAVAGEESDLAAAFDPAPDDLRAAIRSGLQHYLDGVRADPDREKAMFELTQWALREPGFAALARQQYDRYYEVAERAAADASRLTGSTWRLPLRDVARLLVTLTDGLTVAWLATRDDGAAAATIDFAADALAALATTGRPALSAPLAPTAPSALSAPLAPTAPSAPPGSSGPPSPSLVPNAGAR